MLINKHNHNSRHSQLPRTPRRHQTHPSASRHALSSDQVSAEIMSKNMFLHWITSTHVLYIFFRYPSPKRKMSVNSSYFRKHSKRSRYCTSFFKGKYLMDLLFFYKWGNEYILHVRPTESMYWIWFELLEGWVKGFYFYILVITKL